MSHLKPFDAMSVLALDEGKIAKAIDIELGKVLSDIVDRPATATGKTKARKLVIELMIEPHVKQSKDGLTPWVADYVSITPKLTAKLPPVSGGINEVKISVDRDGVHGRWNPEIPDDLDQASLFPADPLDVK